MPDNRAVFITGAAAGIGRATALTFARNGFTVGGYDIDEVGLKSLADEIDELGGTAFIGHLDVTDPDEMAQRVSEFAKAAGDRLDVMINNAGILLAGRFEDIAVAAQLKEIDINTKGVVNGLHAAFPYLRSTPKSVVVNLASASAIYGQAELAVLQRDEVLRPRHHRGARHRMEPLRRPRHRDVAAVCADRDDRPHQNRHDRITRHPTDRSGRRRCDRRSGRTVLAAARDPSGAFSGRIPGQVDGPE